MTPIPPDAPLAPAARDILRERGIVSMERLAGVAYAAPADFEQLVGKDETDRLLRYIEENYPSLVPSKDALSTRRFALGAMTKDVPDLASKSEMIEQRDRLIAQAQRLRTLGDVRGAELLDRQIEQLVIGTSAKDK